MWTPKRLYVALFPSSRTQRYTIGGNYCYRINKIFWDSQVYLLDCWPVLFRQNAFVLRTVPGTPLEVIMVPFSSLILIVLYHQCFYLKLSQFSSKKWLQKPHKHVVQIF